MAAEQAHSSRVMSRSVPSVGQDAKCVARMPGVTGWVDPALAAAVVGPR